VVFTDRHGGVSDAPYATRNLGDHVGDDPAAVHENRAQLARSLPFTPDDPSDWVWLRQVHGRMVAVVDSAPPVPPEADAAVTTTIGLPLVVLTADCAPIALVAERAVGVVHAGWQGLERGVIAAGVDALRAAAGDPDATVRALLGPCIHAANYEFGATELERLVARFGPAVAARTDAGTPAFDLPAAVAVALGEAGVRDVLDADVCTAASPHHFSYRRDGVTGRQGVVVVRTR
jgi:YfiH family protein